MTLPASATKVWTPPVYAAQVTVATGFQLDIASFLAYTL